MKSARLDVRKLGVQAMKEKVKKKAKLDLLMKLGAKVMLVKIIPLLIEGFVQANDI